MSSSPFDVQELVDCFIDFLWDSGPDLKTCALVCHGWVHTAHSRLFSTMTYFNSMTNQDMRILQLVEISRSPHVLGVVSRLEIQLHYLSKDVFLLALPLLTRIREIRVLGDSAPSVRSDNITAALHGLLSLPTVQRVELYCTFPSSSAFLQIWDGCSEKIRHLALGSLRVNDPEYEWALAPVLNSCRKYRLESLHLSYGDFFVIPWLATDACPFDLSGLTTLCVGQHVKILRWMDLIRARTTISHLEFSVSSASAHSPLLLFFY
ncbi:hypothetical protein FB451DRAFT_686306 [Mycena latifolia]|nr:hypothetical protein FB451DRAFT_686306 [Mycena latifolia]